MSNKSCFVDTVCWIALLNKSELIHDQVDAKYRDLLTAGYDLVTTTSVLNETANSLSSKPFRVAVSNFYHRINSSLHIEIVFTDKRLWNTAWQLYEMHKDKEWSLTDCISMVVMKERQISEVMTTDHHFEQAGFVKLLHH